jgi:hypothetical protein
MSIFHPITFWHIPQALHGSSAAALAANFTLSRGTWTAPNPFSSEASFAFTKYSP